MGQPRSYVVRIYRQGFRKVSGVVEDTKTGNQTPFSTIEELWVALRGRRASEPNPQAGPKRSELS
jgi:hypothetical protein